MKKLTVLQAVLMILFFAVAAKADMAAYLNCGVSNLNPTIGLNVEFQYGYASVAVGGGIMAYNDFGFAAGLRGYLFGLDGGPYFEVIYGTTGEKPALRTDSYGKEVVDYVEIYKGVSTLGGWRFFFGDGWNMTFGAGAATLFPNHDDLSKTLVKFVFNVTAGIMFWGDEAAVKNAEKYGKSYEPPEPGIEYAEPEMPDADGNTDLSLSIPEIQVEAEPEWITPTADAMPEPAAEAVTAPAEVTGTVEIK